MVRMKIKVAFPINSSNLYCILWSRSYIPGNKANKLYGICVCVQYNLVEIHQLSFYSQLLTIQRKDYFKIVLLELTGLFRWLSGKECAFQCRKCGFDTWVRKIPWRRKWQPTPVSCLENLWTKEPGRLQSTGSQRVRHDWATNTFTFTSILFYPSGLRSPVASSRKTFLDSPGS